MSFINVVFLYFDFLQFYEDFYFNIFSKIREIHVNCSSGVHIFNLRGYDWFINLFIPDPWLHVLGGAWSHSFLLSRLQRQIKPALLPFSLWGERFLLQQHPRARAHALHHTHRWNTLGNLLVLMDPNNKFTVHSSQAFAANWTVTSDPCAFFLDVNSFSINVLDSCTITI